MKSIDFVLPQELIAQKPAVPRDHARLLVYDRATNKIIDDVFYNIAAHLPRETLVVANNSKVEECRLLFDDKEIFVLETVNDTTVRAMVRPGRVFKLGKNVALINGIAALVTDVDEHGFRTLVFSVPINDKRLALHRHIPLPPYINQDDSLKKEYQTVYAKPHGSLAAPTAGLHFTPELKTEIARRFDWEEITLHVGLGTFSPLKQENFHTNTLHSEEFYLTRAAYHHIAHASHVTAVGTTSARTLETVFSMTTPLLFGQTNIFIHDEYNFTRVNSLVTNFHLPGTSLLLLVASFVGSKDELTRIYHHAIREKYRFYSFGDAMLIL